MKLCTIVTEAAWLSMLKKGQLVCDDICYLDTPEWSFAYEWMMEQMTQHIGPRPPEAQLPLWAWHRFNAARKKPNIQAFGAKNGAKEKQYRLEFSESHDKVLLSSFDQWHGVLNDNYVTFSGEDFDAYLDKYVIQNATPELLAEEAELKRNSWPRIFDLETKYTFRDSIHETTSIQACLWKIELSQVTKVQPYISSGRKSRIIKPRFRCLHDKIQPPFDQYSLGNITTQKPSVQFE